MPTMKLCVTCLLLCLPSPAFAQVTRSSYQEGGGYHEFRDDLLNSDVRPPAGGSITIRPGFARAMLIRPRTSFVREMYKSVDNI